jgi:collagenase-like PrtC family protease
MKFAVGYQLPDAADSMVEIVRDYREHISEVYFPWKGLPSGRAPLGGEREQAQLEADVIALREMGVRLDLLFNASCYGAGAMSRKLEADVTGALERLEALVGGVETVTTTSPFVASVVKRHSPGIEVRASVNMRLGTVQAMDYARDLFDGYYLQRDFNRDLARVRELKRWADSAGKRLYMLANSGCLAFCPGQGFHDNLVAHEAEIRPGENVAGWNPMTCWRLLREERNWPAILQSTWIRPEDLGRYEESFPVVKLATRMHSRPRMVVAAYAARRHRGNLLDLFEPGFSPALAPNYLDNEAFPADWFEKTEGCARNCAECGYCREVLEKVLVRAPVEAAVS